MEEVNKNLIDYDIGLFIKNITYLSFKDVISLCQSNKTLHNYCSNPKYNNAWKLLIDDTFSNIPYYNEKLDIIWKRYNLNPGTYNYLVYTKLIDTLDPITQLMIYYRQGDMDSFNNDEYTKPQRFLALFLLNSKEDIYNYLPNDKYIYFIDMLNGKTISNKKILYRMLIRMSKSGSLLGVKYLQSKGAKLTYDAFIEAVDNGYLDIVKYFIEQLDPENPENGYITEGIIGASQNGHLNILEYLVEYLIKYKSDFEVLERALRWASKEGHLNVVKYLVEKGVDINARNYLKLASQNGHLDIVRYLLDNGADIHDGNDEALLSATKYLNVVRYLVENGADIHVYDDEVIREAIYEGNLDVIKYLVEKGADIHIQNDFNIVLASRSGHLNVVEYLVMNGLDIHTDDDEALILASQNGHLDVVRYLIQNGANINAQNNEALHLAKKYKHSEIVEYLETNGRGYFNADFDGDEGLFKFYDGK